MRAGSKQASPSTTSPSPFLQYPLVRFRCFCLFCPSTTRASSVPTRTKDNRRGRGSATQVFQRCGVSESKSSPSVKSSCFRQLSPSQDLTNHCNTFRNSLTATLQKRGRPKTKMVVEKVCSSKTLLYLVCILCRSALN